MNSVLVTGSNGFLGASLMRSLVERETKGLIAFVRSGSNLRRLEALLKQRPGAFTIRTGSLNSVEHARQALEGVSTVYHLAAALSGAPADMYLNTLVTSKNLLEAVVRPRAEQRTTSSGPPKLVLVSSFGVYGVAGLPHGTTITEDSPLEPQPELRDPYSQTKLRQEQLFWEYQGREHLPLVVLRPGVIFGPGSGAFSSRVGLQLPGLFLFLGGKNLLPMTYVDNCADAIAIAGSSPSALGQVYNVHDDDLPTCAEYLQSFRQQVGPVRAVGVPYPLLMAGSHLVKRYHKYSKGQLPAIFTPYKTATTWKRTGFSNAKLKALGWSPKVSMADGLELAFADLKRRNQRAA